MSAFKKLNKQDVYVTSYVANKSYSAISSSAGDSLSAYNVETVLANSSSGDYYIDPSDNVSLRSGGSLNEKLAFKGIHQLYYSNYISGSLGLPSGSFDNYQQSTIVSSSFRYAHRDISDKVSIVSIPQKHYGLYIDPGSFQLQISGGVVFDAYSGSYFEGGDGYIAQGPDPDDFIAEPTEIELLRSGSGREYVDDREGNLMISSSGVLNYSGSAKVGDIIYSHGMIVLTGEEQKELANEDLKIDWKSSQPIYTYNAKCKVRDYELNFTQNPSAITGSEGKLSNNVTGSNFSPYITTVGLYNDAEELLAVGKLSIPVPKSYHTDMTFVVKIDM